MLVRARARGRRDVGLRFLDVLGPVGIGDELRDKHDLWGCMDLMRSSDDAPFTAEDCELLDTLAPALASVTRRSTAAEVSGGGAPPNLPFAEFAASAVVFNVASRVLARPSARDRRSTDAPIPARARVRSMTGAWAVVEAEALDPMDRTVAVTIRPALASEILDLRLLAYDLTARERELANLVLGSSDTRAVSQRLCLAPHTPARKYASVTLPDRRAGADR